MYGSSRIWTVYDQARLASKIVRAACGTQDPGLIKYIMERLDGPSGQELANRRSIEIGLLRELVDALGSVRAALEELDRRGRDV